MATYQKKFQKPYSTGYKDRPDESTPVTAAIKNSETETLLSIESFLNGHDLQSNDSKIAGLEQGMEGVTNFINNTLPSTYYNKNQTDAKIAEEIGKIPAPKDYDQQIADINDELDEKANSADVYTKSEVYNKSETYTKKEVEDYVKEHGGGGGEVPDDIVLWEEPSEVEVPAIPQPLHRFSAEEKVVGYWVDGKPVYEKTVEFKGQFIGNVNNLFVADNIDTIISHNTIMMVETSATSPKSYYPLPYSHSTASYNIGMFFNDDKSISLRLGNSFSSTLYGAKIKTIMQYTKTTDFVEVNN